MSKELTSQIELRHLSSLRPYQSNARQHSKAQIRQIADSIGRFGFTNPVLIADDGQIIAGHGRVEAAKLLKHSQVPTLKLSHLSEAERRAYVLADNKLALNAGWDNELLAIELQGLLDLDFDLELTGFSLTEVDLVLDSARESDPKQAETSSADDFPPPPEQVTTHVGDLWALGRHRLLCADALQKKSYQELLGDEKVDLIFTDPPYNVPIDGHVGGLGAVHHRDFVMASGEMSQDEFTAFLTSALTKMAGVCKDGAIAFVCMDWRHMRELLDAGAVSFSELKNLCVWNKTNGGMGSFYRSKHELVFVFKVGKAPHINSFGLGDSGRYRTNVWDYAGVSSLGAKRMEVLTMHPTVKPIAMIADALRDCSRRGDLVLDAFGGSGSTLIAAQICGRSARVMELDPLYCDTIINRWQLFTGKKAKLVRSDESFEELAEQRLSESKKAVLS